MMMEMESGEVLLQILELQNISSSSSCCYCGGGGGGGDGGMRS